MSSICVGINKKPQINGCSTSLGGRYDAIVTSGITYHEGLPALPQKLKKDGTPRNACAKRRVGHNLADRLQKHKAAVLRFLTNPDVPFTNNLVERDGRMAKLRGVWAALKSELGLEVRK